MDSLLRRNPRLERIFLRDATLDIPLGPTDEPRLRLDHVRGLILCSPEQVRLTSASFEIAGITIRASGTFLNPKGFSPRPVSSEGPGKIALNIDAVQKMLRSVHWEGERPVLTIEAGGNLGNSESLMVEHAELNTGPGEWRGVRFRQLLLNLHYNDRKLILEKLTFDDGWGLLKAAGDADFQEKKASMEFAGAVNGGAMPVLFLSPEKASDWDFTDPLRLNGSLSADWKSGRPILNGIAQIESGRFTFRGIRLDSFSCGAAMQEGKVLVRDLHLSGDSGTLDADLMIAPQDNRVRLTAALYPAKLASLATGKTREALSSMEFKDPLRISFEGGAPAIDPLQLKGDGTLELGKAAMRGAWIENLGAKMEVANGAVAFRNILLRMGDGTGRGDFIYDYKNWEGLFPGVRSSLDPVKLMTWIDPRIAQSLRDYHFIRPPDVELSGKVGLRGPGKNNLHIVVNAPSGLGYTLIKKDLPFGATSGTVNLKGQKVEVNLPRSRLFGGDVSLKAEVSVAPGDSSYGASVHLEDVDFKSVTSLYFGYTESSGRLTGDYAFRALGGNDRAMTGKGNILIENGNVLAMPILGPLSLLLSEVIPGFGYQSARKATADFTVANGDINTRNLLIKGTGFSMIGHGDIYYLDDSMDMSIRINAQGLPGLATFLISKIFEYESTGSAKHPKWRPKMMPKILKKEPASPHRSPDS